MNDRQLKTKSFDLIKKLEADGWELLVLDSYITTKTKSPQTTSWFAVMVKDGLHIYVEIELENQVCMRDVKMHCPDCGTVCFDVEICPNCETAFVYKKEIVGDYIALAGQTSPSASRVLPCCTGAPQGIIKKIQMELDKLYCVKSTITELEEIQYQLLEKAHTMCKGYKK